MLRGFGTEHSHGFSTPMDPNVKLDLAENQWEKELKDITDNQGVIGSLMYAALATRPDISYAVTVLSRYHSWPFTSHMTAAKRVLQHLKSTRNFRLHFTSNGIGIGIDYSLVGYSDSVGPITVWTTYPREVMCFSQTIEQSCGSLGSEASLPCQLSRPNSLPVWRPPEMRNGYPSCKKIFTVLSKTHRCCQSTATIRVLSL
jgi:hypothetical protein